MNVTALIDAMVKQTTVLIAQLATSAGVRAPLAHLANQVFLDVVKELEAQGLGKRVVADMFGIALRSYQLKVRRLAESMTERNRSLWEVVYQFVQDEGPVKRSRIMERFRYDDDGALKAVLNDLVESGLVYRTGRGGNSLYRAAEAAEIGQADAQEAQAAVAAFVWVYLYRNGPTLESELVTKIRMPPEMIEEALKTLRDDGRANSTDGDDDVTWRSDLVDIPIGSPIGWEAAVFDHFQAMVVSIVQKLEGGQTASRDRDHVGGATYSFDLWDGHPYREQVLGQLADQRERVSALWDEVKAYNDENQKPETIHRVTMYVGQGVTYDQDAAEAGVQDDE